MFSSYCGYSSSFSFSFYFFSFRSGCKVFKFLEFSWSLAFISCSSPFVSNIGPHVFRHKNLVKMQLPTRTARFILKNLFYEQFVHTSFQKSVFPFPSSDKTAGLKDNKFCTIRHWWLKMTKIRQSIEYFLSSRDKLIFQPYQEFGYSTNVCTIRH